jgi:type IV pilus assembly protein PilB
MRQDPDIILVGETRTPETAETVVNASLTGHLVFTTLHTTSAIDAIPRMLSMDVKGYLLAPSLEMIVAQRLVRKLCPHCSTRRPPTNTEKLLLE